MDIEAKTSDGRTALHIASDSGQLPTVEYLLERGAQGAATDNKGRLPLHWASASGHSKCVRTLYKLYPDKIDLKISSNDRERTSLHLAAANDQCKAVATLLECGASANAKMRDGCTALHLAAAKNCVNCIKRLLDKNADFTMTNNVGETLLHTVVGANSCSALLFLHQRQDRRSTVDDEAQQSVYVNSRTKNGETPLHYSARAGCKQCFRNLLEMGADITARDNEGQTALHVAALKGSAVAAEQLCEELIRRSSHGASALNQRNNERYTPLHCAIIHDHYDVVSLLLNYGADVQATDASAATPLLMATQKQDHRMIELLLQHGASVGDVESNAALQISREDIKRLLKQAEEEQEQLRLAIQTETATKIKRKECLDFKNCLGYGAFGQVHKALWRHGKVITAVLY